MRVPLCSLLAAGFALTLHAESPLVVHEWGTFTSFQDEQGKSIGGINSDDEPVPPFVHRLLSSAKANGGKGIEPCNPDVTMRLETPVVYFYPPEGWTRQPVNVSVDFRGGWLTEFYPDAKNFAPGAVRTLPFVLPARLRSDTVGRLSWSNLTLSPHGAGPQTEWKVWLAPRQTGSEWVTTSDKPQKETEKYLFYRGVGHVDAPVQLIRHAERSAIEMREQKAGPHFPAWWVHVNAEGLAAYRRVEKAEDLPADFDPAEFATDNLPRLRQEMHAAIVSAGLFPDEAEALLNTWEVSYFKSPGLRLFYLCPRAEIEEVLPLTISPKPDLTRVLIGRIEVVTPEQRSILRALVADREANRKAAGDVQEDSSVPYHFYAQLGRFRRALLLNEQAHQPSLALAEFIKNTGL